MIDQILLNNCQTDPFLFRLQKLGAPNGLSMNATLNSIGSQTALPLRSVNIKFLRQHINGDVHHGCTTAREYSLNWANVRVISPPTNRHVVRCRHYIVGGIKVKPAAFPAIDANPCMRSIRSNQSRLAGWRKRSQIAAYVSSREIE